MKIFKMNALSHPGFEDVVEVGAGIPRNRLGYRPRLRVVIRHGPKQLSNVKEKGPLNQ